MIDTRMIRKDGYQYVQIIKDGRLIDEIRRSDCPSKQTTVICRFDARAE